MKVIYHGFDGLDLAIKANISNELDNKLESAKAYAQERRAETYVQLAGLWFRVTESGARGGYSYTCKEAESGVWFFKRPSSSDPWGIRFSAASSALAIGGIEGLRGRINDVCGRLGIFLPDNAFSISRVDFAVDFLAPNFELMPDNFVIHSHMGRNSIEEITHFETNGRSARTTSVTVGKMPGRQVIIYDKRAEVIAHRKGEWPLIWGKSLFGAKAPPLSLTDRSISQVWRVEIRSGKRHLKNAWHINGWTSFYDQLPKLFASLLQDIRYCRVSNDSNRARWEPHAIWCSVDEIVQERLFDFVPKLSSEEYQEVHRAQKLDALLRQAFGLMISAAAIDRIELANIESYMCDKICWLIRDASSQAPDLSKRVSKAAERYRHLI